MIFTINSLIVLAACIWLVGAGGEGGVWLAGTAGDGGCANNVEAASMSHARFCIRI